MPSRATYWDPLQGPLVGLHQAHHVGLNLYQVQPNFPLQFLAQTLDPYPSATWTPGSTPGKNPGSFLMPGLVGTLEDKSKISSLLLSPQRLIVV